MSLYASSGSLDGIVAMISRFYGGSTISLLPQSDAEWAVHNAKGRIDGVRVIAKRGRYRFERTE